MIIEILIKQDDLPVNINFFMSNEGVYILAMVGAVFFLSMI